MVNDLAALEARVLAFSRELRDAADHLRVAMAHAAELGTADFALVSQVLALDVARYDASVLAAEQTLGRIRFARKGACDA